MGAFYPKCTEGLLQAANRITACAPQFDNQPCKPLDRPWRERYARQVPRGSIGDFASLSSRLDDAGFRI